MNKLATTNAKTHTCQPHRLRCFSETVTHKLKNANAKNIDHNIDNGIFK